METNALAKVEKTHSERFTEMVVREFAGAAGSVALTNHQQRLVQNYFITIDQMIKTAEEKRLKKSEKYRDALPVTWANVNMEQLALNVVASARIGYDPALRNHISVMPFKNNTTNKYEVVFVPGYRGLELMGKKYGYEVPDNIIVKLVFSNEKFTPIYRDKDNDIESYTHKPSANPFEPGDVVGGYYYYAYTKEPEKNKLVFFNLHEIEKRKPRYASVEFWGGEKDVYEGDRKAGKEIVEGWRNEMLWKTIYRAAYSNITIDSQKIDDDYIKLSINEKLAGQVVEDVEERSQRTSSSEANKQNIGFTPVEVVESTPTPVESAPEPEKPKDSAKTAPAENTPELPLKPAF